MDDFNFSLDLENITVEKPKKKDGFELMPNGEYEVECIECIQAPTKKGGLMWKTTFIVLDPKYHNRRVWHNFLVVNDNEKVANRHKADIKKLLVKKGVTDFKAIGPEDLIGVKVDVLLGVQEASGEYAAKNIIEKFIFANENKNGQSTLPF
jgi:hypothetical protein